MADSTEVPERIRILEKEAMARKAAAEQAGADGKSPVSVTERDPAVVANIQRYLDSQKPPDPASIPARPPSPMDNPTGIAPVDSALNAFNGGTGDLQNILADSATRGLSTRATAFLKGNAVEANQQEVENARLRMGRAGQIADAVGTAAPYAATAGTSAIGAAVGGGVTGGLDATARSYGKTGEAPSPLDVGLGVVSGAGGSVLGHVIGKYLANTWIQAQGELKPGTSLAISSEGLAAVKAKEAEMKAAYKQMDDSGVMIDNKSIANLAQKLEKDIINSSDARLSFTYGDPKNSPYARQAIADLKRLGSNSKGAVPFNYLKDVKDIIRDSTRNANFEIQAGATDAHLVNHITNEVDNFMKGIVNNPGVVVAGNAQQAVDGLIEGNRLYALSDSANVIAAAMKRAHLAEMKGISYDQALQTEMQKFAKPNMYGDMHPVTNKFDEETKKAIDEMARGSNTTEWLNTLDKRFGNSFLGDLNRTYSIATRAAASSGAKATAQDFMQGMVEAPPPKAFAPPLGVMSGSPEKAIPAAGAIAGQVGAGEMRKKFPTSKVVPPPQ